MSKIKEKAKSKAIELRNKVSKKNNSSESQISKITNTTLEEQRKEILGKAKRFKYPVQYSKKRLVINTLIISGVMLITGSVLFWYQLYVLQNTSEFVYRLTTVLPLPVVRVDGEKGLYSDYLMEYRANMTIANAKRDVIEGADDIKALSILNKTKAMKNAIANAYAAKLARENNITISDQEVRQAFESQRKTENSELSENAIYKIAVDNYGLTPTEYRRMFIELPLIRQKVTTQIDKKALNLKDEVAKYLKNNGNNLSKLPEKFGNSVETGAPGKVRINNIDGGRAKTASSLKVGEVSDPFISTAGDGYYIVKLLEKTDVEVSYEYAKISFTEFDNRLKQLQKDGKIQKYINVD